MQRIRVFIALVGLSVLLVIAGAYLLLPQGDSGASGAVPTETAPGSPESQPSLSVTPSGSTESEPTPIRSGLSSTESQPVSTEPMPTPPGPQLIPTQPAPAPTEIVLNCCQCTALGRDQDVPFRPEPGYTCEELCYRGCLQRQAELVCKLGRVSGYALVCPDTP